MAPSGPPYRIMGVVNVTPDSFSDGGRWLAPDAAVEHARRLLADGAELVDIGGESTRPGAATVGEAQELRRVMPVLDQLAEDGLAGQVSIDTSKLVVARAAADAGATMVNDVTALRGEPALAELVAERGLSVCLMHMRGEPRTMQVDPRYDDVVSEVKSFLTQRLAFAVAEGIREERVLLDPGIGFGKDDGHNLELLRRLDELVELGRPVVVGTSRKAFLGRLAGGRGPDQRLAGTIVTCALALERGASLFRVHDVRPVGDALAVASATVGRR